MRKQQRLSWLALVALLLAGSGCCCVQGMPSGCGSCGSCSTGSCGGGACGPGLFAGFRGCAGGCSGGCSGGCGETYVDEWISQPPCVDKCCAGNPMPVRSLLRTLWGSRFVQGCDMCSGGCDGGCDSCSTGCDSCGCGYASAGGSGCTSCGGGGVVSGGGHCSSCAGGATVTEPMMPSVSAHMPSHDHTVRGQVTHGQSATSGDQPRMVPGSFKISQPRRVPASVASERINPARQKIDAKRASYTN